MVFQCVFNVFFMVQPAVLVLPNNGEAPAAPAPKAGAKAAATSSKASVLVL